MQRFLLVWFGQLISTIGSGLTSFALGIWIFQRTGSTALFALVPTLIYLPGILVSPFAGIIVDRLKFRTCLILSDSGSGLLIMALALLIFTDRLQVWHIYIALAASSLFSAFQWTAYGTAAAQLVPPMRLTQANALSEMSKATAKIFAPIIVGAILSIINLTGIIIIDFFTFLFSLSTLLAIPASNNQANFKEAVNLQEPVLVDNFQRKASWHDISCGFSYIVENPGLLRLMMFSSFLYFTLGLLEVLFTPLVLSMASTVELGTVLSLGGCGWLLGGLIASFWKGPVRRINVVLVFWCFRYYKDYGCYWVD